MEEVGKKLRAYRNDRLHLGLKKVAPLLGIDYSYLSKLESGLTFPSDPLLEKISKLYKLSTTELIELNSLANRREVITVTNEQQNSNQNSAPIKIEGQAPMQVKVDPIRTPVLYSDNIHIKVDNNGLVLDIAQQVGPTNEFNIVSRIGLSKDHAKTLAEKILALLSKREGNSETGKVKIVN